jgi:hypothetical protein
MLMSPETPVWLGGRNPRAALEARRQLWGALSDNGGATSEASDPSDPLLPPASQVAPQALIPAPLPMHGPNPQPCTDPRPCTLRGSSRGACWPKPTGVQTAIHRLGLECGPLLAPLPPGPTVLSVA